MKFKLDENLDWRLAAVVAEGSGHEADTVKEEGLSGQPDEAIYKACVAAERILITLDLDFANPLRFPPEHTAGVIVLRPPRAVLPMIEATLCAALPPLMQRDAVRGKLPLPSRERAGVRGKDPPTHRRSPPTPPSFRNRAAASGIQEREAQTHQRQHLQKLWDYCSVEGWILGVR